MSQKLDLASMIEHMVRVETMDPNSGVIGEGFPVAFLKQYYVFDPSFVGSHAKACDEFVKGLNQEEKKQLAKILYKEYGQYITTENKAGDSHE